MASVLRTLIGGSKQVSVNWRCWLSYAVLITRDGEIPEHSFGVFRVIGWRSFAFATNGMSFSKRLRLAGKSPFQGRNFCTDGFFSSIEAFLLPTHWRGVDGLAINNGSRRLRVSPDLGSNLFAQVGHDWLPDACFGPDAQRMMRGFPVRQVVRHLPP